MLKLLAQVVHLKKLNDLDIKVRDIKYTNSDEILNGRVTSSKVICWYLSKRNNKKHKKQLKKNKSDEIDLVIVNFYPFEKTLEVSKNHQDLIENIDIGGPTLVRATAKNYNDTTILTSPDQYNEFLINFEKNKGSTSLEYRKKLSQEAFSLTAYYVGNLRIFECI